MSQQLERAKTNLPASVEPIAESLRAQLAADCEAMLRYALASGQNVPINVIDAFARLSVCEIERPEELSALALLHTSLAQLVAPATPMGIRLVQNDENRHRLLHLLGPVPSIRWLMGAAIFCSLTFFGLSLFPSINRQTLSRDIYDLSGVGLLIPLLFLLSAAGMGATFGALFEAFQFVSEGRFDARFDSIYWARIGLGLVSGLMLAELIPQADGTKLLERPLLALLGGFSAAVVHRILKCLVDGVESVFLDDAKNSRATPNAAARGMVNPVQHLDPGTISRMLDQLLSRGAQGSPPSGVLPEHAGLLPESLNGTPGDADERTGCLDLTIRPGPPCTTNRDGRAERDPTPPSIATARYSMKRPANTPA
jgi:hypothetical protein